MRANGSHSPLTLRCVVWLLITLTLVGCGGVRGIAVVCDESYYPLLDREAGMFGLLYPQRPVTVYPVAVSPHLSREVLAERPLVAYKPRLALQQGIDIAVRQSLQHLADTPFIDLYLCDSERQHRTLVDAGRVMRMQRIASVSPVILIPAEVATESVQSLATLFEHQCRLGVVGPERSGLGEVSALALGRLPHATWSGQVFEFESEWELAVAVEMKVIDAAIVWTFTAKRYTDPNIDATNSASEESSTGSDYLALEPFPGDPLVVPLTILTLADGLNPHAAALFVNFLLSSAVSQHFTRWGFGGR